MRLTGNGRSLIRKCRLLPRRRRHCVTVISLRLTPPNANDYGNFLPHLIRSYQPEKLELPLLLIGGGSTKLPYCASNGATWVKSPTFLDVENALDSVVWCCYWISQAQWPHMSKRTCVSPTQCARQHRISWKLSR